MFEEYFNTLEEPMISVVLLLIFLLVIGRSIWMYKKKGEVEIIRGIVISKKKYPNFVEAVFYLWLIFFICLAILFAKKVIVSL